MRCRPGAVEDSLASHAAALEYVDKHLGRLLRGLGRRGPLVVVIGSDHGTAYGEDGYVGQTTASWLASLREALSYSSIELYLYLLYVRPLTRLGRSRKAWDDEHGPIPLPRGTCRVWQQREYSPEAIRTVRD